MMYKGEAWGLKDDSLSDKAILWIKRICVAGILATGLWVTAVLFLCMG